MKTGMRALLLGIGLLLVPAAASTAHAQCMACASSTSCEKSGERGGCNILCAGTRCACGDDVCGQIRPQTAAPLPTPYAGAGIRLAVGDEASAVVDCRGNFATMAYTARKADELERALDRIALKPALREAEVTVSEPGTRARRSDE